MTNAGQIRFAASRAGQTDAFLGRDGDRPEIRNNEAQEAPLSSRAGNPISIANLCLEAFHLETLMFHPNGPNCGRAHQCSRLASNDLCAQLAPLNRYGLPVFSAAIAAGLRALVGAARSALCAVALHCEAN